MGPCTSVVLNILAWSLLIAAVLNITLTAMATTVCVAGARRQSTDVTACGWIHWRPQVRHHDKRRVDALRRWRRLTAGDVITDARDRH